MTKARKKKVGKKKPTKRKIKTTNKKRKIISKKKKVNFPKTKKHKGKTYTLHKIGDKGPLKREERRLKNSFQYYVFITKKKGIYALYKIKRKSTEERFALSLDTRSGVD